VNNRIILVLVSCGLAIVVVLMAWLYWPASTVPVPQSPKPPSAPITSSQPSPAVSPATKVPTAQDMLATRETEIKREQSIVSLWIMTPITFYGKIVDEKNNPVEGAKVVMSAADQPYGKGSEYDRSSDADGLFSISGIHGVGLLVNVSKEGYYSLPQSWGNFGYALQGGDLKSPHSDPHDPAVFVLRKMGETESLIVQNKNVKTSRDGTPVFMDLHTGRTYGLTNGDIQVQTWTQDQNSSSGSGSHYDWGYAITVPGGGLQSRTGGAFDFTAPEDGYQSTDEVKMSASDPKWDSRMTREYFIRAF
jgi:hypothetical protein